MVNEEWNDTIKLDLMKQYQVARFDRRVVEYIDRVIDGHVLISKIKQTIEKYGDITVRAASDWEGHYEIVFEADIQKTDKEIFAEITRKQAEEKMRNERKQEQIRAAQQLLESEGFKVKND